MRGVLFRSAKWALTRCLLASPIITAIVACRQTDSRDTSENSDAGLTSIPRPGVLFNAETIRPKTRVGGIVLDSIQTQLAAIDSVWVGTARFRGELTLAGATVRHFDSDARAVCFEADAVSAARMPRWEGDERRPWFCFENTSEATRMLAAPGEIRPATVVLDRFTIHRGLSDQVNTAHLVRVIDRER